MPYRAVVFDLDGTLLDTLPDIADSANKVLKEIGSPTHTLDEFRFLVGEGVQRLFTKALHNTTSTLKVDRCVELFRTIYRQEWNVSTKPFAGIPELIHELSQRELKLAVLSNKPQEFTTICIEEYFSKEVFEPIVGQSSQTPPKPDPSGAQAILQKLGVEPGETAYVGDSGVDMQTACRVGMYPIGVLWGYRPKEELIENGAAVCIDDPVDLLPLLLK